MGNNDVKIQVRSLVIKPGMTPEDVKKMPNATPLQKKLACVFDADGILGYSQREANVFNATLITDHGGKNGFSLKTRYSDGTTEETKYSGDLNNFKFSPSKEVKPYELAKKVNKTEVDPTKSQATQIIQEFEKTGKGKLDVETYDNGNIKSKIYKAEGDFGPEVEEDYYIDGQLLSTHVKYYDRDLHMYLTTEAKIYYPNGRLESSVTIEPDRYGKRTEQTFYENGNPQSSIVEVYDRDESARITIEDKQYYPNGTLKSSKTKEPAYYGDETEQTFYEDGKPQSSKVQIYDDHYKITTEDKQYYPNGRLKSSKTKEPAYYGDETEQTFYENGNPKTKVVKEWKERVSLVKYKDKYIWASDWVETTHIEYDNNGNVIKNATVQK